MKKKAFLLIMMGCIIFNTSIYASGSVTIQADAAMISKDTSDKKEDKSSDKKQEQPVVEESGWSIYKSEYGGDIYVQYGVKIKNPSPDKTLEFPTLKMTAKDSSGKIIASEDQTFFVLMPGDTILWGNEFSCNQFEPSTVDFSVSCDDYLDNPPTNAAATTDFSFDNISLIPDDFNAKVTGEITNNTEKSIDMAAITVLYRNDGEIVAGITSYIDNLAPGEATPFDVSVYNNPPAYTEIEISAQSW